MSGLLLGVGITFALASMANLIVDVVRQSDVGIATGINTVTRTVGGSFGAAVATAIPTGNTIAEARFPPRAPTRRPSSLSAVEACSRRRGVACACTRAAERARRRGSAAAPAA